MSSPSGFKSNRGSSALATCLSFFCFCFLFFFSFVPFGAKWPSTTLKNKNHITSPTPRVVTCAFHCPPHPAPPPTSLFPFNNSLEVHLCFYQWFSTSAAY